MIENNDKDLKLYLDMKKAFQEQLNLIKLIKTPKGKSNELYFQKRLQFQELLERLRKRLKIQTLEKFLIND